MSVYPLVVTMTTGAKNNNCGGNMRIIYDIIQWTWGLPQTLVGLVYYLLNIKQKHYYYHGSVVTIWKSKSSLSLGMFVFVSDDPFCYYDSFRKTYSEDEFSNMLLVHEYGHTIQSLFFGPMYLLLVGVPSILWSFLPVFVQKREMEKLSYFSVYPERWANSLGEWITKEPSIGEPV